MKNVEVRSNGTWAGVFAVRPLDRGAPVLVVSGPERSAPDRYSIQTGEDVHVHADGSAWKYLNHSCRPNLRFDDGRSQFIATRRIEADEELSFNYLTTEWEMAEPFVCGCGAPECHRRIAGFKHLPRPAQEALLPAAADHIRRLFERER